MHLDEDPKSAIVQAASVEQRQVSRNVLLGRILVVVLSVIWGLAFVAIRRAVFELSPVSLTLLRWVIVAAVFLALAPVIGRPKVPFDRHDMPRLLLLGFASVGGYHLSLNYAETIVSSGLAGLLISFGPVFAVLLSAAWLKEKVGLRLGLALVLAVLGAVMLSATSSDLTYLYVTGPMAVILAAFMYAMFAVASKPLVLKYGAFPVAIWAAVVGTVMILPLASMRLLVEAIALSWEGWVSVLYLSILSTVVANIILYTLISKRAVSALSVQLYLIPIVSVVGGILLLGEAVTFFTVIGGALLLGGVALATSIKK